MLQLLLVLGWLAIVACLTLVVGVLLGVGGETEHRDRAMRRQK